MCPLGAKRCGRGCSYSCVGVSWVVWGWCGCVVVRGVGTKDLESRRYSAGHALPVPGHSICRCDAATSTSLLPALWLSSLFPFLFFQAAPPTPLHRALWCQSKIVGTFSPVRFLPHQPSASSSSSSSTQHNAKWASSSVDAHVLGVFGAFLLFLFLISSAEKVCMFSSPPRLSLLLLIRCLPDELSCLRHPLDDPLPPTQPTRSGLARAVEIVVEGRLVELAQDGLAALGVVAGGRERKETREEGGVLGLHGALRGQEVGDGGMDREQLGGLLLRNALQVAPVDDAFVAIGGPRARGSEVCVCMHVQTTPPPPPPSHF